MDIHAPERPIASLKDFGIHIAIVTIGILIALGLEGVRESIHAHALVRETRAQFRAELQNSHAQMAEEMKRVTAGDIRLNKLASSAPAMAREHPEQVLAELKAVQNPNFFFATNSWQAALSSGALAHMSTDEVSDYAWAAEATRIYTALQAATLSSEAQAIAFWAAHPHPTPEQIERGTELVLLFAKAEDALAYVSPQNQRTYEKALAAASR